MELSPFELVHSVLWLYMAHERSFKHVFSRANCWTTRGSVAYFPYIFSSTWINDELINEGGWVNTYEHLWNYHMRESPSSKTNYDWMGTLSTVPAPGDPLGNVWWPIAGCSRVPFTKAVRVVHKHVLWYVPVFFSMIFMYIFMSCFFHEPQFHPHFHHKKQFNPSGPTDTSGRFWTTRMERMWSPCPLDIWPAKLGKRLRNYGSSPFFNGYMNYK